MSHAENVTESAAATATSSTVETGNMELLIREKPRGLSKSCGSISPLSGESLFAKPNSISPPSGESLFAKPNSISDIMPETLSGRSSSPSRRTVLEFSKNATRNEVDAAAPASPPKFRGPGGKLTMQVITDLAEKYGLTYTQGGVPAAPVAVAPAAAPATPAVSQVRAIAVNLGETLWKQYMTRRLFAADAEVVQAAAILQGNRDDYCWAEESRIQMQRLQSLLLERKQKRQMIIKKFLIDPVSKSRELAALLKDRPAETKTIHIQPRKLKTHYGPMSEHMLAKKAVGRCDL